MPLLDVHDLLGALPQPLEVVVGAALDREEMHDDVPEVGELPAVLAATLPARVDAGMRVGRPVDRIDERAHLPPALGGRDDEELGEGGEGGQVQQHDIGGPVIHQGVDDLVRQLRTVQPVLLAIGQRRPRRV